jgi:uncharacterized protein (DUF433 family)
LQGYRQRAGKPEAGPVLRNQHPERDGELALGVLDLLEVDFLGRLVRAAESQGRSPSWKAIRASAETARRIFGLDHPFAARRIHTDGHSVFLEAQEATGDMALYDLVADNFAILDVLVSSFVATIEFEDDQPKIWKPNELFSRVVIDPRRSFGRPIETVSGTPVETLFDAWKAEKANSARVAAWYDTDVEGVDQAVRFTLETGLGARRAA